MENGQSQVGLVRCVKSDGRRVYEREAKLAIVREAMSPGVSVAKVALRHGLNANLLRKWIVKHGQVAAAKVSTPKPSLLPVVVTPSATPAVPRRAVPALPRASTARERSPIEIDLPRGVLRFYGAIEPTVLRDLIEALSRR